MDVQIWAARSDRPLTDRETEAMMQLPETWREHALRTRDADKRRDRLCAYGLLRLVLGERYHWRDLPPMARASCGKPYFPDYPAVQFSLSHTDGAVLVGVSRAPIGVDIERIRPIRGSVMRRFGEADTTEAFFQSWVRREARSKRTGIGVTAMFPAEPPLEAGERFSLLETFPGYAAGAAVQYTEVPDTVCKASLEQILNALDR